MFETGLTYVRADFHLHTRKDKEFSFAGEDRNPCDDGRKSEENNRLKIRHFLRQMMARIC